MSTDEKLSYTILIDPSGRSDEMPSDELLYTLKA